MPDATSADLWALRALCESLLRRISKAQKALEHYKDGDPSARQELRQHVDALVTDVEALTRDVQMVSRHLIDLPDAYQGHTPRGFP